MPTATFSIPTPFALKFGDVPLGVHHDGGVPKSTYCRVINPERISRKFHCVIRAQVTLSQREGQCIVGILHSCVASRCKNLMPYVHIYKLRTQPSPQIHTQCYMPSVCTVYTRMNVRTWLTPQFHIRYMCIYRRHIRLYD